MPLSKSCTLTCTILGLLFLLGISSVAMFDEPAQSWLTLGGKGDSPPTRRGGVLLNSPAPRLDLTKFVLEQRSDLKSGMDKAVALLGPPWSWTIQIHKRQRENSEYWTHRRFWDVSWKDILFSNPNRQLEIVLFLLLQTCQLDPHWQFQGTKWPQSKGAVDAFGHCTQPLAYTRKAVLMLPNSNVEWHHHSMQVSE